MTWKNVVFRILNRAGTALVEPRREDGHGSSPINPTHVVTSERGAGIQFQYDADEVLHIPTKQIVYFSTPMTFDGILLVDGIFIEEER